MRKMTIVIMTMFTLLMAGCGNTTGYSQLQVPRDATPEELTWFRIMNEVVLPVTQTHYRHRIMGRDIMDLQEGRTYPGVTGFLILTNQEYMNEAMEELTMAERIEYGLGLRQWQKDEVDGLLYRLRPIIMEYYENGLELNKAIVVSCMWHDGNAWVWQHIGPVTMPHSEPAFHYMSYTDTLSWLAEGNGNHAWNN